MTAGEGPASGDIRATGLGVRCPTISVVIPSYQQGRFIERTLQSVLEQEVDELEVFVCDGGSTDETVEILRRHEDRIRWVSEPDRGQSHAVNKAIAMTSGEIIAWLNSDDVYRPGALALVAQVFRERPGVLALYGGADYIDADDRVQGAYPTQAWDLTALRNSCYLAQPATFFRRELVERLGGPDERLHYCMDYELWLRYAEQTDFLYVPVVLAACRMYPGTKTVSERVPHLVEINSMLRARFPAVPSGWLQAFAITWAEERAGDDTGQPGWENSCAAAMLRAAAMGSARWDTPLGPDFETWLLAHRVATARAAA
jgi:hypothetical protein